MKKIILLLCIASLQFAFAQHKKSSYFMGTLKQSKWVKTTAPYDTIVFNYMGWSELCLIPGNGNKGWPRGIYSYSLLKDSIALHWGPSATADTGRERYSFNYDKAKDLIIIGNFYVPHAGQHPKPIDGKEKFVFRRTR